MKHSTIFVTLSLLAIGNALPRLQAYRDQSHTLIVGGVPAEQGDVPYQLELRYDGQHHCGASIIEVQGVIVGLTAAHCTPSFADIDLFTLVAGEVSLSDETGIEQTRKVSRIVNHAEFDELTYLNDIALLFIDEPYELNENISPIPLPEAGQETGGNLLVSGWGRLSYQGSSPDNLQKVEIPVVDSAACQEAYDELGDEIFESFLCAGYLGEGGRDACQGDSGGPAKSLDGEYLAGVVSWGEAVTPKSDTLEDNQERIIGGDAATDGEIRYQLSLRYRKFHHCGASLIQVDDVILAITAAHCTDGFEPEDFTLVAGDIRLSDRSGHEQVRNVTRIVNHEEWDPDTISYDIGLLFINEPFKFNTWIGPVPLPEQGAETTGNGIVSGWGIYNYQGFYNDNLTKLEVPIVDDELCKKAYVPLDYEYFDHFLCAGWLGIGAFKDSCKGDSGGPLVSIEGNYLAGIVSWSEANIINDLYMTNVFIPKSHILLTG
ncbi:Trypsin-1 [Orchesella cincta]|uniref:Trypsin-1 n=1 Tax=Orchesella cincta TaxID=48709 RepID=A0A1D2N2V4_ORCCI|nr:Trypsin-1 [Orchesella cincta]